MAPSFVRTVPSLPVTSIPDAIKYWTEVLGFRVAGRDRDDHTWVQLASEASQSKDDPAVNVYLRRRTFPDLPNDVEFGKIYITVSGAPDELEQLLETITARGANVTSPLKSMPWGRKIFTVKDPDGNLVCFDQAILGFVPPARSE